MKFSEYMDHMIQLIKEHPEVGDMDVVYSSDFEGNSYSKICFPPSLGHFDGVMEFNENVSKKKYNTVCLN